MKYLILRGLLLLLLCGCSFGSLAQKKKNKKPKATSNTSLYINEARPPKSGKKIRVIYKWNMDKASTPGSKCVDDLCYKKGFRYEQIPKSGPGSMTQEGVILHNLGVKTILLFRNGPFWHLFTKKRIKECQRRTGDYMG